MEWKDLSEEAKGIIEWVVSPITNWKQTIEIKIGEIFHRDYLDSAEKCMVSLQV